MGFDGQDMSYGQEVANCPSPSSSWTSGGTIAKCPSPSSRTSGAYYSEVVGLVAHTIANCPSERRPSPAY